MERQACQTGSGPTGRKDRARWVPADTEKDRKRSVKEEQKDFFYFYHLEDK